MVSKAQKEVLFQNIQDEKKVRDELLSFYEDAREDVLKTIEELEEAVKNNPSLSSKVYQLEFQKGLKKELDGIYDKLKASQYKTVNQYIYNCYERGYVGVMYDLSKQGIPLMIPINQKKVLEAMTQDSKLSKSLYESLGFDVDVLKKEVNQEISRGFATSLSYVDVARNITNRNNIGMNKAMRIARTESHRVNAKACLDAQHKAKETGANIVKQWCSTLDDRTRPSHQMLDGQIRELDEPFEINGYEAQYPGGFGVPWEDINCRCTMLQRAKWALDEDELKRLKERAAYYGLEETKDFAEFEKVYIEAMKDPRAKEIQDLTEEKVKLERNLQSFDLSKTYKDKLGIVNSGKEFTISDYEKLKDEISRSISEAKKHPKLDADDIAEKYGKYRKDRASTIVSELRAEMDVSKRTIENIYGISVKSIENADDIGEFLYEKILEYNKAVDDFFGASYKELEVFEKIAKDYEKYSNDISLIDKKIDKLQREMSGAFISSVAERTKSADILNFLQDYADEQFKQKNLKRDMDNMARRYSMKNGEEVREKLSNSLKEIIDECDIGMRIRGDNLKKVLNDNDGGFKNLFEVGNSGGCSNKSVRYRGEQQAFGFKKDLSDISSKDMPVYGMMIPKPTDSASIDYINNGPGSWYGNGITCVINKDKVINNASFTLGDSLDYQGTVFGSTMSEPRFNGACCDCGYLLDNTDSAQNKLINTFSYSDRYFEVQIHGKENHSYDIIEKVYFTQDSYRRNKDLISILDSKEIPYEVLK